MSLMMNNGGGLLARSGLGGWWDEIWCCNGGFGAVGRKKVSRNDWEGDSALRSPCEGGGKGCQMCRWRLHIED